MSSEDLHLRDLLDELPVPEHGSGFWEELEAQLSSVQPATTAEDTETAVELDYLRLIDGRSPEGDRPVRGRRHRRVALAIAVAAAAILLGYGLVSSLGENTAQVDIDPADSDATVARVGFIGLPPEGATPSEPDHGETIAEHVRCAGPTTGNAGLHQCPFAIWVYADGRVIWYIHADLPEGANHRSTGFLEQRLSPEGVASWGSLVDHTSQPDELVERLRDPADWPAGTWLDHTIRPYVASRFTACFQPIRDSDMDLGSSVPAVPNVLDGPGGWSQLLARLPAPALDIAMGWSWGENRTGPSGFFVYCSHVATEDARALAAALDEAGIDKGALENSYELEYRLEDLPSGNPLHLVFFPSVPVGAEYAVSG